MNCSSGHTNEPGLKFCGECGERLTDVTPPSMPPPPPPVPSSPAVTMSSDDVPSGALDSMPTGSSPNEMSSVQDPPQVSGQEAKAEPDGAPTPRKSRKWVVVGVVVAVLLVGGVVAAVVRDGGEETELMSGTFTLNDDADSVIGSWNDCSGTGGYDDIGPGMNVTVRNGSGEIVATTDTVSLTREIVQTTTLGKPEMTDDEVDELVDTMETLVDIGLCVVYFEVDVPVTEFYEVGVGSRGELSYTFEELKDAGFSVNLSIGG